MNGRVHLSKICISTENNEVLTASFQERLIALEDHIHIYATYTFSNTGDLGTQRSVLTHVPPYSSPAQSTNYVYDTHLQLGTLYRSLQRRNLLCVGLFPGNLVVNTSTSEPMRKCKKEGAHINSPPPYLPKHNLKRFQRFLRFLNHDFFRNSFFPTY